MRTSRSEPEPFVVLESNSMFPSMLSCPTHHLSVLYESDSIALPISKILHQLLLSLTFFTRNSFLVYC